MPPLRMIVFACVFFGALWALHYWVWRRLVLSTALAAPWRVVGVAVIAAGAVSLPMAFFARYALDPGAAGPLSWLGYTWLGLMFYLAVFLVPSELLRSAGWMRRRWLRSPAFDPERRRALQRLGAGAATAMAAGVTGYGVSEVARPVRVVRVRVPIRDLPPQFEGFRIAQLSDVHIGSILRREWLTEVVETVNSLKADMVAITGDLVDGKVAQLAPELAPLGALRSVHGTYFCSGNHELYSGAEPWMAHLPTLGVKPLRNARVTLERGAARLTVAGIEDLQAATFPGALAPDLDGALSGYTRDKDGPLVLLAHQPKAIRGAVAHGVDLQLSGHTHGGQLVPFNWLVYLDQPYIAGLHTKGDTQVYVSRGTGFWGPPLRVGAPAEITELTLERRAA